MTEPRDDSRLDLEAVAHELERYRDALARLGDEPEVVDAELVDEPVPDALSRLRVAFDRAGRAATTTSEALRYLGLAQDQAVDETPPCTTGQAGRRRTCPTCGYSQVVIHGVRFSQAIHACGGHLVSWQAEWPAE